MWKKFEIYSIKKNSFDQKSLCVLQKLYVSVSADGSETLVYSRIGAGGFKFGGLRLQGHPDGSSVSTIFEDLFTEERTGA